MPQDYHQRAFAHNYRAPFIYHIILKKKKGFPDFGELAGDPDIEYPEPGCAYVRENLVGKIIARSIIGLPKKYPILQIYQFQLMPDHVHFILRVKYWSLYDLDFYIEELTKFIAFAATQVLGKPISEDDIFEKGYCDKPLLINRSLPVLFNYIRKNPHRLATRRKHPEFFERVDKLVIGGKTYQAYGNQFLITNPDKMAVRISRKFSREERNILKANWISNAMKGTILVSPFVHSEEKEVRDIVTAHGGKIILITNQAFPENYKPSGYNYDLCSYGNLLIISLGLPSETAFSREVCDTMNALAAQISEG